MTESMPTTRRPCISKHLVILGEVDVREWERPRGRRTLRPIAVPALFHGILSCSVKKPEAQSLFTPPLPTWPGFSADPRHTRGALRCDKQATATVRFQEWATALP